MGFEHNDGSGFSIPVSDTQAYKQFGNAVAVPVVRAIAELMKPHITKAVRTQKAAPSKHNLFCLLKSVAGRLREWLTSLRPRCAAG